MNGHTIAPKTESQTDKLIVLLLAVFTILLLLFTAPRIGLTWDEPTYIVAAETYPLWYRELIARPSYALSTDGISEYWGISHEHPPLSKVWSGFMWLIARHFLDDLTAHRLGNILIAGGLVSLVFLMVRRHYGRTAGLVAAFSLLTMPRFFFHAHLAAIDVPVTAMIFAVIFIFWMGHDHTGFFWTLALGLAWGLALATKINAFFIPPIVLLVWIPLFRPRVYLFARYALMGLIGIGIFILSWPWLYHDLFYRLISYVGFMTIRRYPVEQYYFGELLAPPPWHFPFVITVLVVPASIMILAAIGALSMLRHKEERALGGLFLLSAFFSLAIFTTGLGQVFDNERLMMPVFPYLAALAGVGFARIIPVVGHFLARKGMVLQKRQLVLPLLAILFAPHLVLALELYPHLLSYYSEAIGGVYGAKILRLETTYWCETYSELIAFLNTHAAPGAVVWAECPDVLVYYQLHGKLRRDLQIVNGPEAVSAFPQIEMDPTNFNEADDVVIQYRQSGFYRALREWMYARRPVFEFKYRRLRLAEVYVQ